MLGGYYTWDRIGEARMAAVIISGLCESPRSRFNFDIIIHLSRHI